MKLFFCLISSLVFLTFSASAGAATCTYETWEWDTKRKISVNHRRVEKEKDRLDIHERGSIEGCSVCREDQVTIALEGLPTFEICRKFEMPLRRAVEKAKTAGFPIVSIVGYRVGKSKGSVDSKGLRTEFSNHSFGAAIDFNSETNGLYDTCIEFGPKCKLLRGGAYDPKGRTAITRASPLYLAMTKEGFKWGGEIAAKQKDFMHFSPTGM